MHFSVYLVKLQGAQPKREDSVGRVKTKRQSLGPHSQLQRLRNNTVMVGTVQKLVAEEGHQVAKCAALVRPGSAHTSTAMQASETQGWLLKMFLYPKRSYKYCRVQMHQQSRLEMSSLSVLG